MTQHSELALRRDETPAATSDRSATAERFATVVVIGAGQAGL